MGRPTLYIMVGYPGSGKTTVSQIIHRLTGAEHVWASKVRQERFKEMEYQPGNSAKLYEILNQAVADKLARGQSVIYDTNFRFRKDRDHMRTIAQSVGVDVKLIWIQVPRELAEQRAVEESEDKPTRIWGNMPRGRFEQLADDFDEPSADERPIVIKGINVTEETVRAALGL